MAGTDQSKAAQPATGLFPPAIILVRPQLGENIGMCARAMLNCAVTELRIVKPRDGWPNPDAISAASGAISVLENAKLFDMTEEAIADLEFVLATTARSRDLAKDVYTADQAAQKIHALNTNSIKCGILFGPERTGLENDDVALANAVLNIPLNPAFSSLNLAQAVLLVSYSWLSANNPFPLSQSGDAEPATKKDVENLVAQLEGALDSGGFFRSPDQRPTIIRNIRNYFFRSGMTTQEVSTMHGIFSCLMGKKKAK